MTGTSNIRTGLRAVIATAVLAAAFVLPTQALAQGNCTNASNDPTASQYCSVAAAQEGGNGPARDVRAADVTPATPSGTEAVASTGGSLPFTGLDLGALVLVAAVLTGTGVALWKVTSTGSERE